MRMARGTKVFNGVHYHRLPGNYESRAAADVVACDIRAAGHKARVIQETAYGRKLNAWVIWRAA